MKITALAGGVGGSKLLLGLYRVMEPADLTIIVNTGDDIVMHGLHVSPDPDIITYTLADVVNQEHGWGIQGATGGRYGSSSATATSRRISIEPR
jgi:LPPG:FO 2-phospho-L-lactate transferase